MANFVNWFAFVRTAGPYVDNKFAKNAAPVSSIDIMYEKTCFEAGRMKYFIETFRALGVARGHSSYKVTKSVSFYSSEETRSGVIGCSTQSYESYPQRDLGYSFLVLFFQVAAYSRLH